MAKQENELLEMRNRELVASYKKILKDEFEKGVRKYLNLGHTPAHGIEKLSNYTIPHGKAVGMGLNIILNASLKHGFVDKSAFEDIKFVINKKVIYTKLNIKHILMK